LKPRASVEYLTEKGYEPPKLQRSSPVLLPAQLPWKYAIPSEQPQESVLVIRDGIAAKQAIA